MPGFDAYSARASGDLLDGDRLVTQTAESPETTETITLSAFKTWLIDQIEAGSFDDTLDVLINSGTVPSASPFSASHAGLRVARAGGGAVCVTVAESSSGWEAIRYSGDSGSSVNAFLKARGTIASPAVVQTNDRLGQFSFYGWDGTSAFQTGCFIRCEVVAATPSATDMQSRLMFLVTPSGSTTPTEVMRLRADTGMQMYGANTVIDQNRHHQLRSYTVAGLPSAATAGQMIYVSNETGGATPAFSDGTNWRRVADRAIVS